MFSLFFSGSLLSMLAPEEEEVAALEWVVSAEVAEEVEVEVVVAAIVSLAAVDPGRFARSFAT